MKVVLHLPSKFEGNIVYDEQSRTIEITPRIYPMSMYLAREENDATSIDTYRVLVSRTSKSKVRLNLLPREKDEDDPDIIPVDKETK